MNKSNFTAHRDKYEPNMSPASDKLAKDKQQLNEQENNINNLDEPVLPDDYPVYVGYCYVVDGKVVNSMLQGTVKDLKSDLRNYEKMDANIVRRCDISGRGLNLK